MFKKLLATSLLLVVSCSLKAEIVYQREVKITQINAYDDHMNGAIYLYLTQHHNSCPGGNYLNPQSPGFQSLYSMALAAYMANKTVTIQMYDDRVYSTRCEVDAIQLLPQ